MTFRSVIGKERQKRLRGDNKSTINRALNQQRRILMIGDDVFFDPPACREGCGSGAMQDTATLWAEIATNIERLPRHSVLFLEFVCDNTLPCFSKKNTSSVVVCTLHDQQQQQQHLVYGGSEETTVARNAETKNMLLTTLLDDLCKQAASYDITIRGLEDQGKNSEISGDSASLRYNSKFKFENVPTLEMALRSVLCCDSVKESPRLPMVLVGNLHMNGVIKKWGLRANEIIESASAWLGLPIPPQQLVSHFSEARPRKIVKIVKKMTLVHKGEATEEATAPNQD